MTAPTETEIREHVEREWNASTPGSLSIGGQISDVFGFTTVLLDMLYDTDDLRVSEQEALDAAAVELTGRIRDRAIVDLKEALVVAGLRFASEHPGAQRATRETVLA